LGESPATFPKAHTAYMSKTPQEKCLVFKKNIPWYGAIKMFCFHSSDICNTIINETTRRKHNASPKVINTHTPISKIWQKQVS
jgi:hypothetical protein